MAQRTVSNSERRARLGLRHNLSVGAPSVEGVANDLVVLHATDPATIFLSVSARMADVTVADIENALFEKRVMLRTLAMRRTLFVVTTELAAAVERSSSIDVARTERKRLQTFLSHSGMQDPSGWLASVFEQVLDALSDGCGMAAR